MPKPKRQRPPMPTITRAQLRALQPCWTSKRLSKFLAKFEDGAWTAIDVLTIPNEDEVRIWDRFWVVRCMVSSPVAVAADNHFSQARREFWAILRDRRPDEIVTRKASWVHVLKKKYQGAASNA